MDEYFKSFDKKLGFGCMRLPMQGEEVDINQFKDMVDLFLKEGFRYFDTAHGYLRGKSETAIKEALTSRYPRQAYSLTNKLTENFFSKEEDIKTVFEEQLKACGVTYFDCYLMHAQNKKNYDKFQRCHAYEVAQELKREGKVHHVGISFHDSAEFLEKILNEHPELELVQIQFNYLDFDDPSVESRKCYEVCKSKGIPCVTMEPVKGGTLANLPKEAEKYLKELNGGSNASYAIRFAASFSNQFMVLSGMSNLEQMKDNISFMNDFKPIDEKERKALENVVAYFKGQGLIPCTSCEYCLAGCPKKILIPKLFSCLNAKIVQQNWNPNFYYQNVLTVNNGKASDCIKCGKCESVCPQHLKIRDLLVEVKEEFE